MNKARLVLAALVLATISGSVLSASASHCGSSSRNAHDQFGSCEDNTAQPGPSIRCASGTDVATLATIVTVNSGGNAGVQGCAGKGDDLPIRGRVGAYKDSNNNVSVFIDGDDAYSGNQGGAAGWQRYDVRPSDQSKLVCARRGSGGTWSTGGNGSSNPDAVVNHSVGTGGPGTCQ